MTFTYAQSQAGYGNLYRAARVRPERRQAAMLIAQRALASRPRYAAAADVAPGMPWWWVAAVHSLESGQSWQGHLHNGDPLTRRTTHVPAGRPATGSPPFTWEASARDAITMPPHSLQSVPTWEVERCCYEWERYNGFGYVAKAVNSPYLWSFTTQYERGKYVADGRYSVTAVSAQCGTVAIQKCISELEAAGEHQVKLERQPVPAPLPAAPGYVERFFRWIGLA